MSAAAEPLRGAGPRVVAIGDSITAGVGDSGAQGSPGWAAHVATALGASHFANFAANGTRARGLGQSQIPSALMEVPDVVLMTVGGNDVLRGDFDPAEIRDRLGEALARLERPGREIVIVSLDSIALFALLGRRVSAVMNKRVALTNGAIRAAVDGTAAHLIDGASVFHELGPRAWHVDRIHPSPAGHRAIAREATEAVAKRYPSVGRIPDAGPGPGGLNQAAWLLRHGVPWVAKRSRDLIPQVASVLANELIEERRHAHA